MSKYSVVITTFDKRFEEFLVPLIKSIKLQRPKIEIIVMVNGSCHAPFNQDYRKRLLGFLAEQDDCFPTIFPNFQSLAKMWNRGVITATCDRCLVLNDDLIFHPGFFDQLERVLLKKKESFKINHSFSHFVINKMELMQVGFFDERLLGLGEEDGDFVWRYFQKFRKDFDDVRIKNVVDNVNSEIADSGYEKGIRTASRFNRDFIFRKYKSTDKGYKGIFEVPVEKVISDESQYPYEAFYMSNFKKL